MRPLTSFLPLLMLAGPTAYAQSTLAGKLVDLFGMPLGGATVTVTGDRGVEQTVTTSESGVFTLTKLSPRDHVIEISESGFARERITVHPSDENEELVIGLVLGDIGNPPPIVVTGVIRFSDGRIAPKAEVVFEAKYNRRIRQSTEADASGRYR